MSEKPTAAFVLSLIGGILILLDGLWVAFITSAIGAAMPMFFSFGLGLALAIGILGIIFGLIIIYGSFQINSGEPGKVRTWGIVVLILSIISIITGGGFILGLILGLIGGILALVWKPPTERVAVTGAPPPPPT